VLRKQRLDREFDEELTTHLELLIDEGRRSGMSEADACREALRKLSHPESLRESHRDQRGMPVVEVLAQDLRYAVRMLWKSPAFTCIAALSLGLGIGANTALFSLIDDLLLRSLPVREPDRLVQVCRLMTGLGIRKPVSFSRREFDDIRVRNPVFSEVVGFNRLDRPAVSVDGVTEPSREVERVSENFFSDLGVSLIAGRPPRTTDGAVAIISYRLWRARFDDSPNVLGRVITIDGQAYSVVGIAPARFRGVSIDSPADLWLSSPTAGDLSMIARLKPGVTAGQAQASMQVIFDQMDQERSEEERRNKPHLQAELLPAGKGLSGLRTEYERPLLALTVLVALVLLITCTNVGSLLMVRNTGRIRELTVRVALGARRSRLIVQSLVESAVLAVLGGALGLLFARWGVSLILSMLPVPAIPEALVFQLDARVLVFTAAVSLACALLFGLAPAWRAMRVDLSAAIKSSQGSAASKSKRQLSRLLVASQVGLSVLLVVGAGLFVRTLWNLTWVDVGFRPESLLQVSIDTRGSGYRQGQVGALYRLLLDRVSTVPGVRSVTGIRNSVMLGDGSRMSAPIPGRILGPDEGWDSVEVGPSFFETMGIALLRGRTFQAADFAQQRRLVVISEAFAKYYFPNEDPVGKRIGDSEIVGVVRDAKLVTVRRKAGPLLYQISRPEPDRINALEVRAAGDADAIARAVGKEVHRVNPRLLIDIKTMLRHIDDSIAKERMVAATSAFFSLLGLLLACIGIFGVASYAVAQRTNELGIRIALGAGRWSVIRESLRETMLVFGVGLAAGTIVAIAAVRLAASLLSGLLFGLTATDAVNLVWAVILMVVVALAACILPAARATRVDPLVALRYE
jgi:predicted permease